MLAFADDAALARLVIAAAQRRARLPPRSFPIARSRACPRGLEQSPDAWYPADRGAGNACAFQKSQALRLLPLHGIVFRAVLASRTVAAHCARVRVAGPLPKSCRLAATL